MNDGAAPVPFENPENTPVFWPVGVDGFGWSKLVPKDDGAVT